MDWSLIVELIPVILPLLLGCFDDKPEAMGEYAKILARSRTAEVRAIANAMSCIAKWTFLSFL